MSDYYTPSGNPIDNTRALASLVRAEFELLDTGLGKFPAPASVWGNAANYAADSGAADAYVASIAPTYITSYFNGLTIAVKAANANTGPSTINLNAMGLKTIVRNDGTALAAGDIGALSIVFLTYNSSTGKFHLAGTGPQGTTGLTGPAEVVEFVDKETVSTGTVTFDLGVKDWMQRVQAGGNITLAVTGWPATGTLGELLIEAVNFGAHTITWPTINWVKSDGSTTTTLASNGVTWQSVGTDFVLLWTRDGGTTVFGKVMR